MSWNHIARTGESMKNKINMKKKGGGGGNVVQKTYREHEGTKLLQIEKETCR